MQFLHLIGGDTLQKVVYNQMNKLFTNVLAVKYSGQGKKHKLPFNRLNLYRVVVGKSVNVLFMINYLCVFVYSCYTKKKT